jgi:transposase
VATVKHVAQAFSIDRKTVKTIDKRYLEKALGPPDLSRVCVLAMDEFAIAKGQRYATLFVDAQRKEVLWVCRGHRRADIRLFFEALGAEGRRRLQAVVMDMNGAYEREVRMQCPHAEIVFDHYHIIAKYNHEVINQVRLQELARLSEKERKRTIVKGTRWLLLRNPNNLTRASDRVRLKELLAVNRPLSIVHILRDDLNFLWTYTDPETALASAQQWCRRAIRSRIGPLKRFVQRLRPYLNGIVAHCRYPFHTSLLEGINNKIKVLKRMAYGFQDEAYFFLKTRQAFPGIGT